MKIRRMFAIAIAIMMVCALFAACNGGGDNSPSSPPVGDESPKQDDIRKYANTRPMQVGVWWDTVPIYDSNRRVMTDTEGDPIAAQQRLDNMRAIEERYNVTLKFVDMTFNGAQLSISTSVMAGTPDVDVYCMDLNFGIPYVLAGYCMPIKDYAVDKGGDIYTDQAIFTSVNVCDLPDDYLIRVSPAMELNAIAYLGYNWDILQEKNQPSPQDLWDEGNWTWDTWLEIMRNVTDSNAGTFGWGGDHVRLLDNLLIGNGTGIAISDKEGMTAPATLEVFDFIYKLYNEYNVAKPWDPDIEYWDNNLWQSGIQAFFTWSPWLAQRNGVSKGFGTIDDPECDYTIRVVRWPVGPSGNKTTNNGANLSGNVYMIPAGTPDADIVFDVFYDYTNWYGYDVYGSEEAKAAALEIRNEAQMWVEKYFTDDLRGFDMGKEQASKPQLDMWDFLNIRNSDGKRFDTGDLLAGSATAAQLAEQWKNVTQDYIDIAYGK